jgi:TrmH family RNA methyltransferase
MISKNQIKHIQSLHSKKNRETEGLFIIEGIKLVSEFINSNAFAVKEVFATMAYLNEYDHVLKDKAIPFTVVTEDELKKISLQTTPNQVLAVVVQKKQVLDVALLNTQLTLFLDDIRDPGNLGTIIRIADWFGISQVVCSKNTTELYNPKTLQASMGAVLRVAVVSLDFDELNTRLDGLPVYGAVLNGENIYRSALQKGILVIGNEANGISGQVLKNVTRPLTIPAAANNGSESLNAANACAIICGEFFRQLHFK